MLRDLVCTRLFCGAPYCPYSFLGTVVQSRELPLEGRVIVCAIVLNHVLPLSPRRGVHLLIVLAAVWVR